MCAAKVGQRRGEQIAEAVRGWQSDGGTALLITYTLAHDAGESLADLMRVFTEARRRMRGRDEWDRLRAEVGWVGDVGNWEVSWGEWHHWHPHRHHIVFVRPPPEWFGGVRFLLWWRRLEALWADCVASVSPKNRPGDGDRLGVGVRVDIVGQGEAVAAGGYLIKDLVMGASLEVARPDRKSARAGRCSPWELLEQAVDGDQRAKALWAEYAAAVRGRHRVQWSRRLRETLGVEVRSDEELANEEGEADELEDVDDEETALLLAFDEVTPYACEAAERGGARGLHEFLAMLLAVLSPLERAELRLWARDRVDMAGRYSRPRVAARGSPASVELRRAVRAYAWG